MQADTVRAPAMAEQFVQVVQAVALGAAEKVVPAAQLSQLTSAATVQGSFLVPAGHVSEELHAVQPPLMTRATACVDHVSPGTQALQAVSEAGLQEERWPAAHVLAVQGVHELAFAVAEKSTPSSHAEQEASA